MFSTKVLLKAPIFWKPTGKQSTQEVFIYTCIKCQGQWVGFCTYGPRHCYYCRTRSWRDGLTAWDYKSVVKPD